MKAEIQIYMIYMYLFSYISQSRKINKKHLLEKRRDKVERTEQKVDISEYN